MSNEKILEFTKSLDYINSMKNLSSSDNAKGVSIFRYENGWRRLLVRNIWHRARIKIIKGCTDALGGKLIEQQGEGRREPGTVPLRDVTPLLGSGKRTWYCTVREPRN